MFLYSGGQSLLKTKNDDPGFEIVKEVPASMPRMGNPFFGGTSGLLTSPNLANLATLMAGGSMSNMNNMSSLLSGAGGMGGLMSQSNMLQKCKLSLDVRETMVLSPTFIVNAVTMDWMQGMWK